MSEAQVNAGFGIPDMEALDAFGFPKKYFEITVYEGREKDAESIAKVGVNGRVFQIKRGVKCIVPSVVLETLDHAIAEETVSGENGLVTRPVPRFPYQTHREVSTEEYQAFQAKMRAQKAAMQQVVAA